MFCSFSAANGVVIATEKKLPSILVDETSVSHFPLINCLVEMYIYIISFNVKSFLCLPFQVDL